MFDYIIVGAGSAGCVLANRLSTNPTTQVCLIEAGGLDRNPLIHIPLGLAVLARNKKINWGYDTAPEAALDGRRLYWPRGKTLGGSSSINAMIYARGHPDDYEGWAKAAGPQWGWKRARELFLRMEGNTALSDEYHNTDGPLAVSNLRDVNPMSHAFVQAGVECQFPINPDFNGEGQEGVGLYQVTQRGGKRCSAVRAFLDPVRHRANLTIETGAQAERVIFEERRAVGVSLRGRNLWLKPKGEVILSGGAVNSPQLLMLSGIGPASELARHDIPLLHNAPEVGENLADHLDISVMSAAKGRSPIGIAPSYLPRAIKAAWRFATKNTGELTSNVAEAGGFVKSDPLQTRPNLQFHFLPAYLRDHGRKTSWGYGVTLHVCDLLPKSRGRIRLGSRDPFAPAMIEANYLSHPDDIGVLLKGLKLARRVMAAPALATLIKAEVAPGCRVQSDAALIADIRARAETIYHPVGSCRMGSDDGSVVDPRARVRGVDGLRVVDASIMPTIVAGNTNAPTMMIAENVADMILRVERDA
ncbi:GMC family oxidoreductase [Lentibacter sp. XHP0401]|uniref:GMC family oxidoreductase n=1 Tax=Lentibacter sp. XHP0401 TaxID=2984334 RepID=UPI0021E936AC|nr:GMC family oxidoreductase N-terminal domain-containing protein [Lentibacter sp. XHP0401]MCV2893410.1 GMC family oxidoreductase N-terminal domain-containing protein [Lentibacter sp. XHP0401]